MKKLAVTTVILAGLLIAPFAASAQYKDKKSEEAPKTAADLLLEEAEKAEMPVVITLEQALEIALSENVSVKVADLEIKRTEYAKKGAYAALFPQIDLSASYQRTIKKQVMYMDIDMNKIMGAMGGGAGAGGAAGAPEGTLPEAGTGSEAGGSSMADGMEVGRLNTLNGGVTAALPIINA